MQRKSFAKRKTGSFSRYTEPDFSTLRTMRLWNSTMRGKRTMQLLQSGFVITTRWITSAIFMEYSCLKTIANKHKTSIRKIIRQYKDGKTWSVPYETKTGTKRVRPVKIADCKRGEASDIIYQRKKFSWKTTIRQRLNARVCELCGCKEADLYEVHVIRNLNELGNSDWETVMKKKRRKTLVVCSKCHERIHRH